MTSNYISTDIAGNVLSGNSNDNNNNENYPTKLQNDIDYLNTTGDTLTGDLNLNGNKLYLNNNKKQSIYQHSDDIVLETDDKFIIKNNSNNTLKFYIDEDKIHCNSKRLVSVLDPTDEYDAVNKKYVDRRMSETASAVANQSSQKTITSNLDMKTFEIINLSPGTDPKSAVTKDQLDMAIQETLIPGGKRYLEYSYIISNFKPGFWISSHFNNGLIIKSSNDPRDQTVIENLVNKTITTSGDKEQTISNGVYGIRLKGTNRIVSSETYTTKFTFFFVISADSDSSGRLITSDEGNILFGYWTHRLRKFLDRWKYKSKWL